MAIPFTKYTFTDSVANDVTAARLNAIGDAIEDAQLMPAVRAYHNTTQSVTTATLTTVALNSERFDQFSGAADTMHDNVTNNSRLTCRYAGIYNIIACLQWPSNASGSREAYLVATVSGVATTISESVLPAISGNVVTHSLSAHYSLAVNDYVELKGKQSSGGTLVLASTGNSSPEVSMVRVA